MKGTKKITRSFISVVLAAVMCFFAACSGEKEYITADETNQTEEKAKAENRVTIYTYVDPSSESQEYNYDSMFYYPLLEMVHMYNNYCSLNFMGKDSVTVVRFSSRDRMIQQMSTEIMAGGGPDIIALDNELPINKLIKQEAFVDLNPYIEKDNSERAIDLRNFNKSIMDTGVFKGKRYMIPMLYMPDISLTDTSVEDKYGLKSGEQITYDNMDKKLDKFLKDNEKTSFLEGYESSKNLLFTYIQRNINIEKQTVSFDTKDFRKNIEFLKKLVTKGKIREGEYNSYIDKTCMLNKGFYDSMSAKYDPINYCLPEIHNRCTDSWGMEDVDPDKLNSYAQYFYSELYDEDKMYRENYKMFQDYVYEQEFGKFEDSLNGAVRNDFVSDIAEREDQKSGTITCGFMINANSKFKDKAYEFIKYSLCERMQRYITNDSTALTDGNNTFNLPVNTEALKNSYTAMGYREERINKITKNSTTMERYLNYIINLNDFKINDGYYQKNVIGDLVENYLNNKISQDNFITNLISKTKIYLYE